MSSEVYGREGSLVGDGERPLQRLRREERFEGRVMPPTFAELLGRGGRDVPEEAAEIPSLVAGLDDYADLPESRRRALRLSVINLSRRLRQMESARPAVCPKDSGEDRSGVSPEDVDLLVTRASRLPNSTGCAKKSELAAAGDHRAVGSSEPTPASNISKQMH